MASKNNGVTWWLERWNTPIAAVGLTVAIIALVATSCHQSKTIRLQMSLTAISQEQRVRGLLVEGARRFEEARSLGNENLVKFERNFLLSTIEAYLVYSEDLQGIGVKPIGNATELAVGVLRVLATGFCRETEEPAGEHFTTLSFAKAGALADERDIKTCQKEEIP